MRSPAALAQGLGRRRGEFEATIKHVIECKGGETSAVRDDSNPSPLSSRAGAGEEFSRVEEFDNAVHAHKTNSAEQGVMDEVGREAPQAQARRGRLMPARLQH